MMALNLILIGVVLILLGILPGGLLFVSIRRMRKTPQVSLIFIVASLASLACICLKPPARSGPSTDPEPPAGGGHVACPDRTYL